MTLSRLEGRVIGAQIEFSGVDSDATRFEAAHRGYDEVEPRADRTEMRQHGSGLHKIEFLEIRRHPVPVLPVERDALAAPLGVANSTIIEVVDRSHVLARVDPDF